VKSTGLMFTGEMARALAEKRKTQTRRIVKPQPAAPVMQDDDTGEWGMLWYSADERGDPTVEHWTPIRCPYGGPGDEIWARESIRYNLEHDNFYYAADNKGCGQAVYNLLAKRKKSRPSILMPRGACRSVRTLTAVRIERLCDISEADAQAEGIQWATVPGGGALSGYKTLWERLNAKRGYPWSSNPFVWVLEWRP